jgi:hypothetical protein
MAARKCVDEKRPVKIAELGVQTATA